jgi:peptide/nickel transport system permease protein
VFARLLRGQMLGQRHSDHVLAATALGVKKAPIIFRHVLPNSMSPVIVQSTIVIAVSILDAAALSFLGLGSQDAAAPEWGQMLGEAQTKIDYQPHLAFLPAIAIIIIALGFTLLGESMREAIDPRNRR